jgi:hypothetical protein
VNGSQDGSGAAHLNRAHASLPHRPSAAGSTQPGVGAVLYARASLDRSGRQSSVTTQDRKYKLLCEQNEWRSIGRFVDNDVSASKSRGTRAVPTRFSRSTARRRQAFSERPGDGPRSGLRCGWQSVTLRNRRDHRAWHPLGGGSTPDRRVTPLGRDRLERSLRSSLREAYEGRLARRHDQEDGRLSSDCRLR